MEPKQIFLQFFPDSDPCEPEPLGEGLINTTYRVRLEGKPEGYVLQKLNTSVFKDPEAVMRNSVRITEHMRSKLRAEGKDPTRHVLEFCPRPNGEYLYDAGNGIWRCSKLIEGAHAHTAVSDPALLYATGKGYGEFQRLCSDFPAEELAEVLPDFHNTPKRLLAFLDAVDKDVADRKKEAESEIRYLLSKQELAGGVVSLLESGQIPLRVTHNDTKLSNVLLDDQTGEAVCVIDLDTVMPGSVLYDFGDAIRTGAASTTEDDLITDHMKFLPAHYDAFKKGFLESCGESLWQAEIDNLMLGARVIIYEQALRFLTDFLNGDTYYKTAFAAHNLVRARTQIRLLAKIEDTL